MGANLVLDQAGGRRKQHVWRYRGHDDHLYFAGRDASLRKAASRRFNSQIAGGHPWINQVTLPDPETLHDPLVGGVYHFCQIGVVKDARRHIGSQSADLGTLWRTRTQAP